MADAPRELLADALRGYLTPEQLAKLIDEVLAIEKRANPEITCKHCGRKQMAWVQVPDAKAVALALPDLLNQAFGRVGEASGAQDPVAFKRLTITDTDEDVERALWAVQENRRRHRSERSEDGAVRVGSNGNRQEQAAGDTRLQSIDPGNDETQEVG